MLKQIQRFEAFLERVEGGLLAILVVVMLSLAVYNVFYRNVLVPIQAAEDTAEVEQAAPVEVQEPEKAEAEPEPAEEADSDSEESGFGGGFGDEAEESGDSEGFGGGFGDEEPEPAEEPAAEPEKPADDSGGFGGGFGDDEAPEAEPEATDDSEGFGGGFDDGEESEPESDDGGFGGGFDDGETADKVTPEPAAVQAPVETVSVLDKEHSFIYKLIDSLKLEWIDVLLRQFVLLVGFLGAMLAARRRKHITIDALSKVVPERFLPGIEAITSLLAAVICVFLAISGWDLVQISLEYPKELMHWANESTFQMMFPIGFGLLSFHFSVRVLEHGAQMMGMEVDVDHDPTSSNEEEE